MIDTLLAFNMVHVFIADFYRNTVINGFASFVINHCVTAGLSQCTEI